MSNPHAESAGPPCPTVEELGRELSARTIMFHEAAARMAGLSATENKTLDLLTRAGEAMTAGRLAEHAGLTTGAITGIVDRLERAGFVRRERSASDRRQVLIYALEPRQQEYLRPFDELGRAVAGVYARYSDEERAVICDFVTRMIDVMKQQTEEMRRETIAAQGSS